MDNFKTVELPGICTTCGKIFDLATATSKTPHSIPKEGDYMLCIGCGEWNILTANRQMRKPTEDELIEVGSHPAARELRIAWTMLDDLKTQEEK
jgi:hypothetical protein